jgi:digeranylgeranylglycerophospholipid reductase
MILVDRQICAYCGGCVSVCPVGALALAETRLVVSADCIDCGDCISACPVGALRLEGAAREPDARSWRAGKTAAIRRCYDVVVVGAGPGGATAARTAAQAGLSVLLLEKRQEVGSPVRCAEGVGRDGLLSFIEPDPLWIAAEISQAEITLITGDETETRRASGGHGYVLERRVFDRVLAERAAAAGAEVWVKSAATGLLMEEGRVRGVRIQSPTFSGGEVEVEAQVVIAADGVEAQVGRWAGLYGPLSLRDTMVCVQYLLAGIAIDPTCTCYTIGHEVAPGGYAWVFPKGQGKANVGLGVQADLWQEAAVSLAMGAEGAGGVGGRTVLEFLTRFIEDRPSLAQGYPVTLIVGNVPVAPSPARLVTDGLMLVGDAARQVDPLTGGGIVNGMLAGQFAAQVAAEAIASGDTSSRSLARYQDWWSRTTGRKMLRNYRLRERFPPAQRTDERFVRAFALAVAG